MKKISAVMPCKNLRTMTEETVRSLIANTPHLGEIILIDDHSTEDMTGIDGVNYHLNIGTGVNAAWNYGASLAKYPYIAWINNDLLFSPNWEQPLIEALNDEVLLVSPYHTAFEVPADFPAGADRKKNLSPGQSGLPMIGCAFMMEKDKWEQVGPIDERLKIFCGDNYIYETIIHLGKQVKEISESYVHHLISRTVGGMNLNLAKDYEIFNIIYKEKKWKT